ncbi:MAG: hypothetical protein A4E57_01382 [Syntrophorhabdaceae bacterium PtaU1.Bin034]|jgi:hypothetical protein|nr:MAG: hypothetical protein A4E57_01382 [Syntrophorhabdaceae bacterium PtaU1.Bin034]
MSKVITVCPFSKMVCRECAIYRGRHAEMCMVSKYRHNYSEADRKKAHGSEVFTKWDMPDLPGDSNIMVDIEDFIERRGI